MASKVYWKTLRRVAGQVERYIERWDEQLSANLTTEQYNCVRALLAAVIECLALLPTDTPT